MFHDFRFKFGQVAEMLGQGASRVFGRNFRLENIFPVQLTIKLYNKNAANARTYLATAHCSLKIR